MSVSKKLRALNRARTEHDNARLSAQFAASKCAMNHIADSVMARAIERQAEQIYQLRERVKLLRDTVLSAKAMIAHPDNIAILDKALAATEPKL